MSPHRFGAEMTRAEANQKVELTKVFGPADLLASKDFGGTKIFQVFVVSHNINCSGGAFEIVLPDVESIKNSQ